MTDSCLLPDLISRSAARQPNAVALTCGKQSMSYGLLVESMTGFVSGVIGLGLLCENEGNSVDLDLAFLFRHFDRRICIGTDWPEYSPRQVRERFEEFTGDLPDDQRHNIAYRNLYHFLGLDDEFSPLHPVTDLY